MVILKKLLFAPIFLIIFGLLVYRLAPLMSSYDFIFSLSIATFIQLTVISTLVSLSSFLFILFATLAWDWRIIIPVALIGSSVVLIFIPPALALVFTVAVFVSFLLTYLSLDSTLKSYINFQPSSLLGPAIRHLSSLLVVSFCLVYFLSSSKLIAQNGFQIPDSLIDTALKILPTNLSTEQNSIPPLPTINPQQLEVLKKNPDLLKQYGLDPKMLDNLSSPQSSVQSPTQLSNDGIKPIIKDQIQNFIKPYTNFIPAVLTLLLFLTIFSLVSFINLLIYPLLWIIFSILEKTGFIRYIVEQRPIRKMVVGN